MDFLLLLTEPLTLVVIILFLIGARTYSSIYRRTRKELVKGKLREKKFEGPVLYVFKTDICMSVCLYVCLSIAELERTLHDAI